ncbi:hypothetical protein QQS21_003226 [Conoideocrella luteorostrata]|uniref:Uncharacterized protein n=1 Tax=Conoideocrella luteorostrata TaxID=1105319 RepID=A0AAJ0FVT4_9HYPO|nr:hypothetical protein QQS21_003226 [Conoideocrella luteorostrata]
MLLTDRFENAIPTPSNRLADDSKQRLPNVSQFTDESPPSNNRDTLDPGVAMSRLHFLILASQPTLQFCYNLASAAVNRYPVPMLLGWNGQGEFDAAKTHLAKLRTLKRYLHSLNSDEDDDLVIIVDGFDIIHQLPAEVILERYFEVAEKADAHLAQRLAIPREELLERNIKQSVFFGPDKVCWPRDARAARCWAAPASTLGANAFGPDRGPVDITSKDPRWLNSGTVIGPIRDIRRVVDVTIEEIGATYDTEFWQSDSDQYYLSNVWGRQEYWRNPVVLNEQQVREGPFDGIIPEKKTEHQETELHMAVEYGSSLFQTKAGNEPFVGHLQYNLDGHSASMNIDLFGQGEEFMPYPIMMPDNVRTALMKLYDSIPDAHPGASAANWIKLVHLGTNFVTKHIYGLWHCTGPKESLDSDYTRMWFYPFVKSLLRESLKASRRGEPISSKLIDGRRWVAKWAHPEEGEFVDEYGGAWSDEGPGRFVSWGEMCGQHESVLFWGQWATGM